MLRFIYVIFFTLLTFNVYSKDNRVFYECHHSDKSKSLFLYSFDKNYFYVLNSPTDLSRKHKIISNKNNIIYAERFVSSLKDKNKMVRYSSYKFNKNNDTLIIKNYCNLYNSPNVSILNLTCNKSYYSR